MPQVKNLRFSGKVGPVIFYYVGDKFYVRSAPVKVRQSKLTIARSTNFGMASAAGKLLREGLGPVLPDKKDKPMQSRFSGAISKWLGTRDIKQFNSCAGMLYHFRFNPLSSFAEYFRVAFTVINQDDGSFSIDIEPFNPVKKISAPPGTVSIECIFSLASCILGQRVRGDCFTVRMEIPFTDVIFTPPPVTLPSRKRDDNLIVIAGALIYTVRQNDVVVRCADKKYLPSSVIVSSYTGYNGDV